MHINRKSIYPQGWEVSSHLTELYKTLSQKFVSLGFTVPDIEIGYFNSVRKGGECLWLKYAYGINQVKLICISRYLPQDQVTQTMLHEMCHAVLPYGEEHGPKFMVLNTLVGGSFYVTGLVAEKAKTRNMHIYTHNCGYKYISARRLRNTVYCPTCVKARLPIRETICEHNYCSTNELEQKNEINQLKSDVIKALKSLSTDLNHGNPED